MSASPRAVFAVEEPRERFGVDADRQRLQPHDAPADVHLVHPAAHAEQAQHAVAEVLHVAVRVKREVIRPQQPVEHLVPPRQQAEHRARRERDVEEEPHPHVRHRLAQQLRQQHELVVVHPHEVVRPQVRQHRVAEHAVRLR